VSGPQTADEALILCNPFLEEKVFAQRIYYNLALEFSKKDKLAVRFDFEGDGDSEGDTNSVGLSDWIDDLEDVAQFVRTKYGIKKINVTGLRLGASIALMCVDRIQPNKILLWDPVVDGEAYLEECLRYNLTTQLSTFQKIINDRKNLLLQLAEGKSINILGFEVSDRLASPIRKLDLIQNIRSLDCLTYLVSFKRRQRGILGPKIKECDFGSKVITEILSVDPFWQEPKLYNPIPEELIEKSVNFLMENR
jgi:hypothetical protein